MITVIEYNTIEVIDAIRDDWHALLAETPCASFFHTPEWLEAYWQFFAADQQLRIMVVRDAQRTVGIVPLVVQTQHTKIGKLQLLTTLDDWGDFNGPIGNEQRLITQAVCEHLKNSPQKWDIFEPRWVDDHNLPNGEIFSAMQQAGLSPYILEWSSAALVEMSGTLEEYWGNWTSKERAEQRRNEKRLAKHGAIKHIRHRPEPGGDPRWDLFDVCKQIARESWQGKSTTGTTLSHASVEDFMRHTHKVATQMGCLDINLIYQDDVPAAFSYGYHYRGHVDGSKTGYVPGKKTNGAGRVLIARMIEDSFERKDLTFNMGSGKFGWKNMWQTKSITTYGYSCYSSKSWRGQALKLNRWMKSGWQHLANETKKTKNSEPQRDSKQSANLRGTEGLSGGAK